MCTEQPRGRGHRQETERRCIFKTAWKELPKRATQMSLLCGRCIISLQISTDSQLIFAAVASRHLRGEKSLWSFSTSAQARERRLVEARIKECGPLVESPGRHPAAGSSTGAWKPASVCYRAFQNLPEKHPAHFRNSRPAPDGRSGAAVT